MTDDDLPAPVDSGAHPFPAGHDPLEQALGMPLPDAVKKNFWKAVGRGVRMPVIAFGAGSAKAIAELFGLVAAPVKLARVSIEAKTRAVEARTGAAETAIGAAAKAAATAAGLDPAVGARALARLANELVSEQNNRENIARKAFHELRQTDLPMLETSPDPIDEDWLTQFWRLAETKSSEEFQGLFARILAGEILRPGSFSPAVLQALATMSPSTAREFEALCNASFATPNAGVFVFEWTLPGIEERYRRLMELQALRLIVVEGEHGVYARDLAKVKGDFAGSPLFAEAVRPIPEGSTSGPRCTYFTEAGVQLRRLIALKSEWNAARAARDEILESYGVRLVFPGSPLENEAESRNN